MGTELAKEVQTQCSGAKLNRVWDTIRDNDLKNNRDYSAYNFRSKRQEDEYQKTGNTNAPSIYNSNAVDFIVRISTVPSFRSR